MQDVSRIPLNLRCFYFVGLPYVSSGLSNLMLCFKKKFFCVCVKYEDARIGYQLIYFRVELGLCIFSCRLYTPFTVT